MKENSFTSDDILLDNFDFNKILSILWSERIKIVVATAFFALFSIIYAISLPNIYISTALVKPAESTDSGIGGVMNQYVGLAGLAGISIPGSSSGSDSQLAINLLQSKGFLGSFIKNRAILPDLMAAESWEAKTGQTIYDSSLYDSSIDQWVRSYSYPQKQIPSLLEAHEVFMEHISISQDKKTQYITISIEHLSPLVAQSWVSWLIEDVNLTIADMRKSESKDSINYLQQQISSTPYKELKTMFYEIIQEQTKLMMLANVRKEYALITIDAALIPEVKSKPRRSVICFLITFFGFMSAILYILVQNYIRNRTV